MAFPLTVNVHINVDEIGAGALLEALHDHRDAVRDLVAHEQQGLFTDDLCHQLLLRHIGVGIIIKVMGAFYGVAAQGIEQRFTAVLVADADRVDVIEYTQRLQLFFAGFQVSGILDKVCLIDDGNGRAAAAAQHVHQNHLGFIQGTIGLKQHHGNIHVGNGIAGGFVHALAQLVAGFVYAGGIQQHILQRAAGDHTGNAGTGGLRLGGDNGHLFANQQVGQAGFAHIGAADDRHKNRRRIVMALNGRRVTQNQTPVLLCAEMHVGSKANHSV